MKKTRILALVLSVLMVAVLFAGCNSGTPAATTAAATTAAAAATTAAPAATTAAAAATTAAAAATTAAAAATTAPPAGGNGAPVHLTWGDGIGYQYDPCGWWETEIYAEILSRANVEIESLLLDGDKYALELASGDLQDIMYTADSSKVAEILSAQMALDVAPLIADYCPNLAQNEYAFFVGLLKYLTGDNEKLYFLPEHVGKELPGGGVELARGYYLRWDWYKEIGTPEINNDDDFLAAIEQMVANHPTNAAGEKVYGTGISDSLSNWWFHSVMTTVKCNPWTYQNRCYMQSCVTGELLNGYMDVENSPFWNSMIFYNKLNSKGLLDPDSFTMTSDEVNAKHAAGRYAASMNSKNGKLYSTMRQEDPNTLAGYVNIPSPNQLVFADNPNPSGWFPSFTVFINAKSDKTIEALQLWNFVYDLDIQRAVYCGFEGKYWNYVDGKATLTQEAIDIYSNGGDTNAKIGLGGAGPFTVLQTSEYHPDGELLDLFDSNEVRALGMTPLQRDVAAYYGVTVPAEAGYKFVTEGKTVDWSRTYGTELLGSALTAVPTDIGRILENCNDILYRSVADLVTAESEAEFNAVRDSVLEELKAADEATAWEWCLNEFNKGIETLKPIMGY